MKQSAVGSRPSNCSGPASCVLKNRASQGIKMWGGGGGLRGCDPGGLRCSVWFSSAPAVKADRANSILGCFKIQLC